MFLSALFRRGRAAPRFRRQAAVKHGDRPTRAASQGIAADGKEDAPRVSAQALDGAMRMGRSGALLRNLGGLPARPMYE